MVNADKQQVKGFVNLCSASPDKLQDRISKSAGDTNHAVTLSGRVSNDIHQLDQNRVVVSKEDSILIYLLSWWSSWVRVSYELGSLLGRPDVNSG